MSWPCKVFSLPLPLLPSLSLPSFLPVMQFCRPSTSKSQYQSYLDYVKEIGETVGFLVEEDTLRIPSSKRVSHGLGGEGGGDELTKEREGGMKIFERDAVDIPYISLHLLPSHFSLFLTHLVNFFQFPQPHLAMEEEQKVNSLLGKE